MRRKKITEGQVQDEQDSEVLQSASKGEQGTRPRPGASVPGEEGNPKGGWAGT